MNIEDKLKIAVKEGFKSVFSADIDEAKIQVQPTRKEFEGSFTVVMFPFLREAKTSPEQAGEKIGEYLVQNLDDVSAYNVVKGFLNLVISENVFDDLLKTIINEDSYGQNEQKDETVMVEYSSPNTNKPLHLGHLRNNFLGHSISSILDKAGFNVVKANLINDRGIHICKSMLAYEKFGEGETPESAGIKGDHLIGKYYVAFDKAYKEEIDELKKAGKSEDEAKKEAPLMLEAQQMLRLWEEGDDKVRELWTKMNNWVYDGFNATYKRIGVEFDKYYYESDTYLLGKDLVDEGLASGAFFKKDDGSVWADLSADGLDEKLVLRGDGTSVYMTQDMGTADLKYQDYKLDKSIYVVGNEQDYHFKVLQLILSKLGRSYAAGIYHMSYGMVDLPSGKMKSREGTVVDADDLIQEMVDTAKQRTLELGKIDGFTEEEANELYEKLALGALKYYLLKVDPKKRMLFNPKESIDFQGNTGPFIQYTYARISSLLRKASELNITVDGNYSDTYEKSDLEKSLLEMLHEYPKAVKLAADEYAPSVIANFVYDLAKAYNKFYAATPIFKDDNQEAIQFRMSLSLAISKVIKSGLLLLGIQVPERM